MGTARERVRREGEGRGFLRSLLTFLARSRAILAAVFVLWVYAPGVLADIPHEVYPCATCTNSQKASGLNDALTPHLNTCESTYGGGNCAMFVGADVWAAVTGYATMYALCSSNTNNCGAVGRFNEGFTDYIPYAYATIDDNTCLLHAGTVRTLAVPIDGNSSSAIPAICYQSCKYDLNDATNVQHGSQWWRTGTWTGTADHCDGQPISTGTDTGGGGGGGGECDTESGDFCDGGPITTPEGCELSDATCLTDKANEALVNVKKLTDGGGNYTSVIGNPWGFPSLPWLDPHHTERVCSISYAVPNIGGRMHTYLGGGDFSISFCDHVSKIDSIGGFLLYVIVAIFLWATWRQTPGS